MLRILLRRASATIPIVVRVHPQITLLSSPMPPQLNIPLSHFSFLLDPKRLAKKDAKVKKKEKRALKRGKPGTNPEDLEEEGVRSAVSSDDESILSVDPIPETYSSTIDVGPSGLPLFTNHRSISSLTRKDVNSYIDFRWEDLII